MKRKYTQVFAFIMAFILFISCPLSVYASEKWEGSLGLTLYYNKDKILQYFKDTGKFWLYAASEAGAILKADFVQFAENYNKMDDILSEEDKIGVYVDKDDNAKGVFFSKEFMAEVKALIEQYAKENEPYFIVRIPSYKEVNVEQFATKGQYLTICNLAKKYGLIGVNGLYMSDLSEILNGNYSYVFNQGILTEDFLLKDYVVSVYDESWDRYKGGQRYKFDFPAGTSVGYEAIEDGTITGTNIDYDYHFDFQPDYVSKHNGVVLDFGTPYYQYEYTRACLISRDGIRTRVFKSMNDFKNYSVGNRKVYYTKDYYDYEPDDLSASVDDLEKSVDELQKIIDELLKKIDDLTSESDIEDLLKQILDALKNQQGTGGGGSGGGDVVVDVDLTETNGWLSKIYTKLSQVFDKISSISIPSMRDVVTAIEDLSQMLKRYLSEITGDLDDIKGQLEEMSEQELNDKTDSFLSQLMDLFSEISEVAKGKFPFSLPSDMQFLIARISGISPETAASYSYGADTVSALSLHFDNSLNSVSENDGTDHGGSGSSRPGDDPDPPGGGGSSRPGGSGFVSVEHGGGGSGREPVSSNNWSPVFTLPIVIERYGIEEYIVLDMSVFDPVSKMSRTLFLIMYIVCLYNMTFKVIGLWGDLVG